MKKKHVNVIFPSKKKMGKRNWGKEILLALVPKVLSLKLLKIKKGKKGGIQYHHKKNECGYILSGKLLIRYDSGNGTLKNKIITKGQSFHFPPNTVHQEKALSRCVIIEASTPHFNDRVRVEKKYGLVKKKGLPSTKINQVILK